MFGVPEIAVGAVVAALIAGLVSLLGLIVSKEQKISEFRQAWIDGLREELSSLVAHGNAIHGAGAAQFKTGTDAWAAVRPDFVGINEAAARIRLRLNPIEQDAIEVLNHIERLEGLLAPGQAMDHIAINATEKNLVSSAQIVLKKEWRRVQRGESVYRVARIAALCISVACVAALLAFAITRLVPGHLAR